MTDQQLLALFDKMSESERNDVLLFMAELTPAPQQKLSA